MEDRGTDLIPHELNPHGRLLGLALVGTAREPLGQMFRKPLGGALVEQDSAKGLEPVPPLDRWAPWGEEPYGELSEEALAAIGRAFGERLLAGGAQSGPTDDDGDRCQRKAALGRQGQQVQEELEHPQQPTASALWQNVSHL